MKRMAKWSGVLVFLLGMSGAARGMEEMEKPLVNILYEYYNSESLPFSVSLSEQTSKNYLAQATVLEEFAIAHLKREGTQEFDSAIGYRVRDGNAGRVKVVCIKQTLSLAAYFLFSPQQKEQLRQVIVGNQGTINAHGTGEMAEHTPLSFVCEYCPALGLIKTLVNNGAQVTRQCISALNERIDEGADDREKCIAFLREKSRLSSPRELVEQEPSSSQDDSSSDSSSMSID